MPLGLSLGLSEKTLLVIQELKASNPSLSGTIVKIEGVGFGFFWNVKPKDLEKSVKYFRETEHPLRYSIHSYIERQPAKDLMMKIHRLNRIADLPGILNFLRSQHAA